MTSPAIFFRMRLSSYRSLGDGASSNSCVELLNRYALEIVHLGQCRYCQP